MYKERLRQSLNASASKENCVLIVEQYLSLMKGICNGIENIWKCFDRKIQTSKKSPEELVQSWGVQEVVAAMLSCFVVIPL